MGHAGAPPSDNNAALSHDAVSTVVLHCLYIHKGTARPRCTHSLLKLRIANFVLPLGFSEIYVSLRRFHDMILISFAIL
jgi:hypothetical protein